MSKMFGCLGNWRCEEMLTTKKKKKATNIASSPGQALFLWPYVFIMRVQANVQVWMKQESGYRVCCEGRIHAFTHQE